MQQFLRSFFFLLNLGLRVSPVPHYFKPLCKRARARESFHRERFNPLPRLSRHENIEPRPMSNMGDLTDIAGFFSVFLQPERKGEASHISGFYEKHSFPIDDIRPSLESMEVEAPVLLRVSCFFFGLFPFALWRGDNDIHFSSPQVHAPI